MKVVKIYGSLGQQMFQYAFFLSLLASDSDVCMSGRYLLPIDVFELTHGDKFETMSRLRLPWGKRAYKEYVHVHEPADGANFSKVMNLSQGNILLDGSWLSYHYFECIEDEVRKQFIFRPMKGQFNALRQVIHDDRNRSVAMHICTPDARGNTCTCDYYNWAVANINTFLPDAEFFVFCDSHAWVRKNIVGLPDNVTLLNSKGMEQSELMQLMASAGHVVMSATLADWWAAYLNTNPDKIVITPQRWGNGINARDLLPLHWTIIPVT